MRTASSARQNTPARARAHLRTAPRDAPQPSPTEPLPRGELTALPTPSPTAASAASAASSAAAAAPPQTPSTSLSGRTIETLRLARERQFESAKKPPRPSGAAASATLMAPAALTKTPLSSLRTNRPISSSVPRPRAPPTTSFNPSRSRPTTPVTAIRASTPITPSRSNASFASSPITTPKSVRVTSAGSSVVVRDAIRKAKEVHKQKQKTPPGTRGNRINYSDDTSFDDVDNPFNTSTGTPPLHAQLKRAIENGRTTGNLNISNLELQEIPEDVFTMYDLSSKTVVVDFSTNSSSWFESVDLQRFNAAGNEISQIDERLVQEFGAMKHFDIHSNRVPELPPKFESLQFLRSLNLSKNNFLMDIFDIISNLTTLSEVYLAHNSIKGPLPNKIGNLGNLQILDLEGNQITSLPDSIRKLTKMRILLLGENSLSELPWEVFEGFPDLYELDVYSNKLGANLLPAAIDKLTLPTLSTFDIHSNGLASLPSNLHLPSLTQFNATQNSITTTGTFFNTTPRLVHLSLGQNQLSVLPEGVVHLSYLRSLDLSNNVIEYVDPRLGSLDKLTTFLWMGNLIRARGWGSMDTEGIKSALRAKADEVTMKNLEDGVADMAIKACHGDCAGTLNLTAKLKEAPLTDEMISEHLHPAHFPPLTKIVLQQNKLTVAPSLIGIATTLTTLDLSKNSLFSSIFDGPIILNSLVYLDLSVNRLDNLDLLPVQLSAPALKTLDASFNYITSIIPLRSHYPLLRVLHANSNQIVALEPSDIEGLEIVQVNNNSINKLVPELGKVESLRILGVDGNTFRVPGRRVLDGGSAGLLEWLRSRCVEP